MQTLEGEDENMWGGEDMRHGGSNRTMTAKFWRTIYYKRGECYDRKL